MESEVDYKFKIVLTGNCQVGKSCIMDRCTDNNFKTDYFPTIGLDFKITTIDVNGLKIKLQIWDTGGQERYRNIVNSSYKGAHSLIVVFDVTNTESFQALSGWINDIDRFASERRTTIIVGNKSDLEIQRQVTFEEARNFAGRNEMNYIEISALRGHNIKQLFKLLTIEMISKLA